MLNADGKAEETKTRAAEEQPDAVRKATLAKLRRALSIIDEHDEGILSLQQLLQVCSALLQHQFNLP